MYHTSSSEDTYHPLADWRLRTRSTAVVCSPGKVPCRIPVPSMPAWASTCWLRRSDRDCKLNVSILSPKCDNHSTTTAQRKLTKHASPIQKAYTVQKSAQHSSGPCSPPINPVVPAQFESKVSYQYWNQFTHFQQRDVLPNACSWSYTKRHEALLHQF